MTILSAAVPKKLSALISRRAAGSEPVCLYSYDLGMLTDHVGAVVAALPDRCRMFYAMKANSARPLLQALAPLVDGFEVASGGELTKARAVGEDIPLLFGGPAKTEQEIAQALEQRVQRLHVESVLELHRISEVAARAARRADVLLRVNLGGPFPPATLSMAGGPSQFGIDESLLAQAVRTAVELPGVRLVGFHLHSLSNNLSATAHLEMLDLYRRRVTGWEDEFGLRCEVINVGGGIGVDYADTSTQFDWEFFTEELRRLVEQTFPSHWREIDFECGRFLVAACGSYVVELLDIKRNHGVNYLLVRGGTHHFRLPASWQHSHPFTVLPVDRWHSAAPRPELRDEPVTVVGELCSPKDVLARDVVVPRARAGDVLVFHHAGAYGWEISHHDFLSHPHPEHVFLGGHVDR
jgi:2-[(L-alanin-3-ylcarbamoyl)methyl]-2-hydroxybutanedioate decarboxylase